MLDDVIRVMPQSAEIYEQLTLIERIEVTQNIAFHLKNLYVVLQQQEIVQTSII